MTEAVDKAFVQPVKPAVIHLVNCWPSESYPIRGIFIVEQVDSLAAVSDVREVVVVKRLAGSLVLGYLRASWRAARLSKTVDVLHVHHLLTAISLIPFSLFVKCRVVISLMNDPGANIKGIPGWLDQVLIYLCARVFGAVIFKGRRPSLPARARSACIPNGVDVYRFAQVSAQSAIRRLGLDPMHRYLLFVSANDLNRPIKRKDLFDAVAELLEPQGFRPLYMANVPREEVPYYFSAATVFLLCSDVEGSPNALKEALASGVAIVARNLPGVQYLLAGCPGVAMFERDDPVEIATLVRAVAKQDNSEARREHVSSLRLTLADVSVRIGEFYGLVISGRFGKSKKHVCRVD